MTFLHKRLGQSEFAFGADLRDLRESRDLPLSQVARDTRIPEPVLQAFEEERLETLGDLAFRERHLMAYVRYLGGHEPYFIARYRARIQALDATRKTEDLLPRTRKVRMGDLIVGSQAVALAGVLLLGCVFGGYILWQAHLVRTPPPLTVTFPSEGEVLEHPTVVIQGTTMPEAYVTINGRPAAVDPEGRFSLSMDVRRGTTVLEIVARRRRGSETQVARNVVYDSALLGTEFQDMDPAPAPSSTTMQIKIPES